LVHVSALANRFVSDPREVVKSGQVVRVKVLEADPERKRISLTLRLDDEPSPSGGRQSSGGQPSRNDSQPARNDNRPARNDRAETKRTLPPKTAPMKPAPVNTAMAEALRKAGLGK
jgi:uncharacterized protein